MTIFNRNDAEVVESAISLSPTAFVRKYVHLTTEKALIGAYKEIRIQHLKKHPQDRERLLKQTIHSNIPSVKNGDPLPAAGDEEDHEEAPKPTKQSTPKPEPKPKKTAEPTKVPESKAKSTTPSRLVGETKQERIVNLIKSNPSITNKEITDIFAKFNAKVYGSEIANARNKI